MEFFLFRDIRLKIKHSHNFKLFSLRHRVSSDDSGSLIVLSPRFSRILCVPTAFGSCGVLAIRVILILSVRAFAILYIYVIRVSTRRLPFSLRTCQNVGGGCLRRSFYRFPRSHEPKFSKVRERSRTIIVAIRASLFQKVVFVTTSVYLLKNRANSVSYKIYR